MEVTGHELVAPSILERECGLFATEMGNLIKESVNRGAKTASRTASRVERMDAGSPVSPILVRLPVNGMARPRNSQGI